MIKYHLKGQYIYEMTIKYFEGHLTCFQGHVETNFSKMRCNGTITVNTNQFKYLEVKTRSSTSAVHTRPGAPNSPKI